MTRFIVIRTRTERETNFFNKENLDRWKNTNSDQSELQTIMREDKKRRQLTDLTTRRRLKLWRTYTGVMHCIFDQIPNLQNCCTTPGGLRQINNCCQISLLYVPTDCKSETYRQELRPKNTYIDQEADRCGKDSLPLVLGSTALPRPNIALKSNSSQIQCLPSWQVRNII
jgi:hypothetical protein